MTSPFQPILRAAALAAALAGLASTAAPASAQRVQDQDSLRVFLVTVDQGAAVWERFGHNAIWVHDPASSTDVAYHWGLFDMSQAGFLTEFLQGRMFYYMGADPAPRLIDAYRADGRDVTVQELALSRAQADSLQAFLEWNIQPENRQYRYDYFRDNCSTRVRDALDDALGGRLRRALSSRPAEHTYRSQAVALTAPDALLTTGMDLGLGPLADHAISHWELAYIPMRLQEDLRDITVERNGEQVSLVLGERRLEALGPGAPEPVRYRPMARLLAHLLVGLLMAGALAGTAVVVARGAGGAPEAVARWLLGVLGWTWGLVAGAMGLILLGLWTLTDHEFAWRNENLLQANPLALALLVLVPVAVLRGGSRWATRVAGGLVALSLFGLFVHPLPVTPQANGAIIALALPIHIGLFYALWRLEPVRQAVSDEP